MSNTLEEHKILELCKVFTNWFFDLILQMSIDCLLDRTIKHMLFLQSVTKYADRIKQIDEPKVIKVLLFTFVISLNHGYY